jgi:hypothetical protein
MFEGVRPDPATLQGVLAILAQVRHYQKNIIINQLIGAYWFFGLRVCS